MQNNQRLYLITLEIAPLIVGESYNPLPSHLTLMSRFWSDLLPNELANAVRPLFHQTRPIELAFTESVQLGPNKVPVCLVESREELKLHHALRDVLDSIGARYEYPQFIGAGHRPHVSKRQGDALMRGDKRRTSVAYLIEVQIDGKEHWRIIRAKFDLAGH